jgi:hypothetical protein
MSLSTQVMYQLLHKATSTGQMSGSLSSIGQIAKMPEYLEAQRSALELGSPRGRKRERGGDDEAATPVKKKKKKVKAPAPAVKKASETRSRYEDVAGALGPNSLPRMKGGNPAGEACKDHASGHCKFKTCPYSHK